MNVAVQAISNFHFVLGQVYCSLSRSSAEPCPEGHCSTSFVPLSMHRCKNWAVTAKGSNRFVWNFETSEKENVYGMFAAHGTLPVAKSETSLEVHDVRNGWDWAKVPGARTIAIRTPNIDDLIIGKGRFINPRKLARGLTFKGTMGLENGLFGTDFHQPNYRLKSWRSRIQLDCKRSVFFFENLLVCLGSVIVAQQTKRKLVQTTFFQDRFRRSSSHRVAETSSTPLPVTTPSSSGKNYTTLTDTKGNFYYIPNPSKLILKVHVKNQNSKKDDRSTTTSGHYGKAWFDHERTPVLNTKDSHYEYTILKPTNTYHQPLRNLATVQETPGDKIYEVLKKDDTAHIVRFLKSPKS